MEHPDVPGLSEWRPLARGGLAVVWQARQRSLDRLVAVKVYQRALDDGERRRFQREAAAAGRLSTHPGIVSASTPVSCRTTGPTWSWSCARVGH